MMANALGLIKAEVIVLNSQGIQEVQAIVQQHKEFFNKKLEEDEGEEEKTGSRRSSVRRSSLHEITTNRSPVSHFFYMSYNYIRRTVADIIGHTKVSYIYLNSNLALLFYCYKYYLSCVCVCGFFCMIDKLSNLWKVRSGEKWEILDIDQFLQDIPVYSYITLLRSLQVLFYI